MKARTGVPGCTRPSGCGWCGTSWGRCDATHAELLSAGVALRRPMRPWCGMTARGAMRVENLADRRYVASAFLNPDVVGGEPVAFEPGLPRQVVVSVALGAGR